jgi:hypothetical protein
MKVVVVTLASVLACSSWAFAQNDTKTPAPGPGGAGAAPGGGTATSSPGAPPKREAIGNSPQSGRDPSGQTVSDPTTSKPGENSSKR